MPKVYVRKYQREIEDLYWFLLTYDIIENKHYTSSFSLTEERREQLLNWLWGQTGHREYWEAPHLLILKEEEVEINPPPKATPEGREMILHLYETWRSSESDHVKNPGEKAKALLMKEFGFKTKQALDKFLQRARRKRGLTNKKTVARDDDCPF